MNLSIIHLFIVVTTAVLTPVASDTCRSIVNADFDITCSKIGGSSIKSDISIHCKTGQSWLNFPRDKLNSNKVRTVAFQNCNFPRGLSLFNITTNLGLSNIDKLEFENLQSTVGREHLKGFVAPSLKYLNNDVNDLPNDLLYDIGCKELIVINSGIKVISDVFFKNSRNLKNLEFMQNELKRLKQTDFALLKNLEILLLVDNKIEEIEPGTFDNLIKLRVLDISDNKLKILPNAVFHNLFKLERIRMSVNHFQDLPADLFRIKNSSLQIVRMNHNRGELKTLPGGFFRNLTNLNHVELKNNNFSSLPGDVFFGTVSLVSLDLRNNRLVDLPKRIFGTTHSLKELNLSENILESLPERLLEHLKMEILHLGHNRLTNLRT